MYCLNVLTQKFATSDQYQYCPSWALAWDYRKNLILQDILQQSADIVCLQVGAPPLVRDGPAPAERTLTAPRLGQRQTRGFGGDALQEVETAQFFDFFQVELGRQVGYQGIYRPKSRAKTMSEDDARNVDGCAIFYRPNKYARPAQPGGRICAAWLEPHTRGACRPSRDRPGSRCCMST